MKHIVYILLALSLELTAIGPASGTPTAPPPDEVFAGYKLIEQWRIEEAGTLAKKLLDKYPESGDAHFLSARVEFLRGNYEYARKILTRVGGNHAPVREFKKLVRTPMMRQNCSSPGSRNISSFTSSRAPMKF